MQNTFSTALSLLVRRSFLANNGATLSRASKLIGQCNSFSTQPLTDAAQTRKEVETRSGPSSIAVSLTWSAPAEQSKSKTQSAQSPSRAARGNTTRPYYLKLRAAAALRIEARASLKASKVKADLKVNNAALKAKQRRTEAAAKVKAALTAAKAKQLTIDSRARNEATAAKKKAMALRVATHQKLLAINRAKTLQAIKARTQVS